MEDTLVNGCNQCHSIRITGGNRDGTDRFITVSGGTLRHVIDPKTADWTSIVQSMISKGSSAVLAKTAGYLNTNYCTTCTALILGGGEVTNVTETEATISWTTSWTGSGDEPSTGTVYYSTNAADLDAINDSSTCPNANVDCVNDPNVAGTHTVTLTNLPAGKKIYFKHQSSSGGVPVTFKVALSFTTEGGCAGPIPPRLFATTLFGSAGSKIVVFDPITNQALTQFPIGDQFGPQGDPGDMAPSPDGTKGYAMVAPPVTGPTATSNLNVYLVDEAGAVTAGPLIAAGTYGFPPNTNHVIGAPDGTTAYAASANSAFGSSAARIQTVDTITAQVTSTFSSSTCTIPLGIGISPDGSMLYLGCRSSANDKLLIVDPATNAITHTTSFALDSLSDTTENAVAVSPDGTKVFLARPSQGTILVFDGATGTITGTINSLPVGAVPRSEVITPDGARLYVADSGSPGGIHVIDLSDLSLITTAMTGAFYDIAVHPDGSRVYAASLAGYRAIDTATNTDVGGAGIGSSGGPTHIMVTPGRAAEICPVGVDTIAVSPSSTTIAPDQTQQFTTVVKNSDGEVLTGVPLAWTSGDPNICDVDENGLVTGVAVGGPVDITASAEGVNGVVTCTVVEPHPDLQANNIVPTLAGDTLHVYNSISNLGNVKIDSAKVGIYLSPDSTIEGTGNDILIGERTVTQLPPGGAHSANNALTFVSGIPTGYYYVGMIANYDNLLQVGPNTYSRNQETDPNNNINVAAGNFLIGPDVKVYSLTANFSGTNILISDTEQNTGGLPSGAFDVSFYFSASPSPNPATDPLIGSRSLANLEGGYSTDSATTNLPIPASVPMGSYYVCAISDSGGTVNETDETNNTKCTNSAYSIGPDLKAYSLAATPSGTNLVVSDTQQNVGNQAAGPFDVSFYLSATTTPNPATDTLLGSRSVAGLDGGFATDSSSSSLPIPPGVTTGNYYVCAISDSGGAVDENDEGNNVKCTNGTYQIGPDLKVYSLIASISGTNVRVSDTEQNSGNAPAGPFEVSFYFSTSTTPNPATDPLIGSRSISGLNGGFANNSATTTLPISPGVSPGTYRVCAISDSGDAVDETDETNNTKCTNGTLQIGPDLKVYAVTANKSGSNVIVSDTEQNAGNQAAGPFDVSFYLSLDTTLDGSDLFLGSRSLSGLNGGSATNSASNSFAIPTGASGSYYVFAVSDSGSAVTETNENNNTKRTGGKVTLP